MRKCFSKDLLCIWQNKRVCNYFFKFFLEHYIKELVRTYINYDDIDDITGDDISEPDF